MSTPCNKGASVSDCKSMNKTSQSYFDRARNDAKSLDSINYGKELSDSREIERQLKQAEKEMAEYKAARSKSASDIHKFVYLLRYYRHHPLVHNYQLPIRDLRLPA